jgi:hypothetical protein
VKGKACCSRPRASMAERQQLLAWRWGCIALINSVTCGWVSADALLSIYCSQTEQCSSSVTRHT